MFKLIICLFIFIDLKLKSCGLNNFVLLMLVNLNDMTCYNIQGKKGVTPSVCINKACRYKVLVGMYLIKKLS